MPNYLNSIFSTSLSRGRLSYFLNSLAAMGVMVAGVGVGAAIAAVEGPSTEMLGLLVGGLIVLFGVVAAGFLFAQRVRDLGLPVAFVVASYYVLSMFGGVLTTANETASIIFSLISMVFSLYIMLMPGTSTGVPRSSKAAEALASA